MFPGDQQKVFRNFIQLLDPEPRGSSRRGTEEVQHVALSRTVHKPAGRTSSARPAEPSAPERGLGPPLASHRPPLESSSVTVGTEAV